MAKRNGKTYNRNIQHSQILERSNYATAQSKLAPSEHSQNTTYDPKHNIKLSPNTDFCFFYYWSKQFKRSQ